MFSLRYAVMLPYEFSSLTLPTDGTTCPAWWFRQSSDPHLHMVLVLPTGLKKQTPWPEIASELYRLNDRSLVGEVSANILLIDGCHVVSVTDPPTAVFSFFLDRSRYYFFQVAPQLYSRSWVDPVPDPLLLRKSGSAGNRTRTSGSAARNSDH
jgi:hypothetical protein